MAKASFKISICVVFGLLLHGCAQQKKMVSSDPTDLNPKLRSGEYVQTSAGMAGFVEKVSLAGDADDDGVLDTLDKCPGTPKGANVDPRGCPTDMDGDGIYDHLDKCPDTPKDATVDEGGCWVLKGVYFDTDKWDLKPSSYPILNEVVFVLKRNPELKIEIQGHTDNVGEAWYNRELSRKRAKAVIGYFIQEGISPSRLSYEGYGFSSPAASNATAEARGKNRRVELRPIN